MYNQYAAGRRHDANGNAIPCKHPFAEQVHDARLEHIQSPQKHPEAHTGTSACNTTTDPIYAYRSQQQFHTVQPSHKMCICMCPDVHRPCLKYLRFICCTCQATVNSLCKDTRCKDNSV